MRRAIVPDPPLDLVQQYWKLVEDLYHVRCGCRNFRAFYLERIQVLEGRLSETQSSWPHDPVVVAAFTHHAQVKKNIYSRRVDEADHLIKSWFQSRTSVPDMHLSEVDR